MWARLGIVLAVIWLGLSVPVMMVNELPLEAYLVLGGGPAFIVILLGFALSWVFGALMDQITGR